MTPAARRDRAHRDLRRREAEHHAAVSQWSELVADLARDEGLAWREAEEEARRRYAGSWQHVCDALDAYERVRAAANVVGGVPA